MQITSNEIANNKYMQIYLTKDELEKQETKAKIERYKNEKYHISIFISGKENYPEILERIIVKQVELNRNIC